MGVWSCSIGLPSFAVQGMANSTLTEGALPGGVALNPFEASLGVLKGGWSWSWGDNHR